MSRSFNIKPERIVKIDFMNRWIDLKSIVSISDALYSDGEGEDDGIQVGIEIISSEGNQTNNSAKFQWWRSLSPKEYGEYDYDTCSSRGIVKKTGVKLINGEVKSEDGQLWTKTFLGRDDQKNVSALHNLQKDIDELVELWKEYKNQE